MPQTLEKPISQQHQNVDARERERLERAFSIPRKRFMLGAVVAVALFIWSANGAQFDFLKLGEGATNMGEFIARMFPPDFSDFPNFSLLLLETLQMAIVGTVLGAGLLTVTPGFRWRARKRWGAPTSRRSSPAWKPVSSPCRWSTPSVAWWA